MLGAGLAPLSIGSSEVNDATRFELSQKLPFFGKRRLRGEAALGEAEAAAHDFAAVRLRLAAMASLASNASLMSRLSSVNGAMAMLANPGFAKAMQQMGGTGARAND